MVSRRDFLRRSAALVAASPGAGLLWTAGCSSSVPSVAPSVEPVRPLRWETLARELSGRLVLPNDSDFAALARPNNLRYAQVRPMAIALCAGARDVRASILWARDQRIPLIARSGGHSYAGYSTTTGLMIDVRRMRGVAFDSSTGVATFGGGARNAEIYAYFRSRGVAVTHGRCLSVGVAGLTLGGGVGFNMRTNGLTCDQLVATEIVTADGTIHRVSAASDYDGLYWACRGAGGGNFGINTSFAFQTFEVRPLTAYELEWESETERVFAALCELLERAPSTLACKLSATVSRAAKGAVQVQLLGQFAGSRAELLDILQPAYAVATPSRNRIVETGYWEAQDFLSEPGEPSYYQERSRFFDVPIGDRAVSTVFTWLRRWPATVENASFKLFLTGGTVNALAPDETAFVHRKSLWLSSISVSWNAATSSDALQRNLDWQSGFYGAVVPLAEGGAYQNFIDPSLDNWQNAYYGSNLPRLQRIKKRVDPAHVFRFPEAIP